MMYETVYNLSFNSHCRILAAEPNFMFTNVLILILHFDAQNGGAPNSSL